MSHSIEGNFRMVQIFAVFADGLTTAGKKNAKFKWTEQ